ncbi:transposase, partial [Streptomyces sp. ME19-01-6]|uniref:transposase n=1 Tax=Streptomyces sp. ME19-01-6 TaxID=3028686 RepID=UPI0029AC190D
HLDCLADLFLQSLHLAQKLGMVKMGRVALDGTKLQANASKHKAMSYGRLVDKEVRIETEIAALEAKAAALLEEAEATDTAEDQAFGPDGKQADLPAELDRREKRLAKLQAARAQIEAEAAEKARAHAEDKERRRQERAGTSDEQALVDAGYCPEANLEAAGDRQLTCGTDTFMATGRPGHDEQVPPAPRGRIPKDATLKERMARRLRTKPGRAAYSRRKAIIEPVFGQIMTCQGGRQLLLRGEDRARGEWRLLAACHNLRKIFRHAGTAGLAAAIG